MQASLLADLTPLPAPAQALLDAFLRIRGGTAVRLIGEGEGGWEELFPRGEAPAGGWAAGSGAVVEVPHGPQMKLQSPLGGADPAELEFLAYALAQALSHEREARSAARELTERYEEINLLYFISEILASVLSVPDAATRILTEVADVLGARRASLWVYRSESEDLAVAAAVGEDGMRGPIRVDDPESATAWVFRERQSLNLERGKVLAAIPRLEPRPHGREAFLSVPINYTPPDGTPRTVGVITLVGRRSNVRFSAGDARLLAAIASQIGAALETQRLVQESLRQERTLRELELAHDLQLKLLPDPATFDAPAQVAARCEPAESVGGDFYQLFRLSGDRLGIMIGDVSSHGFSAALIMALTLSAVGIYAQEFGPPTEVLRRVHRALAKELESTEMYMTLFYGVMDLAAGQLTYANAGHPHAFRVTAAGAAERLGATGAPLGMMAGQQYEQAIVPWTAGSDMLLLFTDGLSDALSPDGIIAGENTLVEAVVRTRALPLTRIIDEIFQLARRVHAHVPTDDRTAVLVRG